MRGARARAGAAALAAVALPAAALAACGVPTVSLPPVPATARGAGGSPSPAPAASPGSPAPPGARPSGGQPGTPSPPASPSRSRPPSRSGPPSHAAARTPLRYRYLTDDGNGRQTAPFGYNLVDLGPYRSLIDALRAGQRALVWIGDYSLSACAFTMSDAAVRRALAPLARDPKVAGYYIADEADDALPAYGGHCPRVVAQVTARSRLVHRLAPGAFTYEVVTEPGNFAAFARATDVLGADPYPCLSGRACDWSMIPRYIAALRAAHVRRYWGVLQAFADGHWRYPTPAELRRMIGQWERSGWQGEQTFAWSYAGHALASRPGLLAVLRSLNDDRLAAAHPDNVVPYLICVMGGNGEDT